MSDDYYLNDVEDVTKFLNDVFKEVNSEYVVTPRMTQIIYAKIVEDYNGASAEMTLENTELCDYLKGEYFVRFVENRQPNISMVPENVIADVQKYFKEDSLSAYTPVKVCRHSNHPDDAYLYSVVAVKADGSFACWSTFNDSTKSINYGHYNMLSEEDALAEIRETFFDITDDMEKYGPEQSLTDIGKAPEIQATNDNEIVAFRHRSR